MQTTFGHTRLQLGPLDQMRVSVSRDPHATLISLLADVHGGRSHGVPDRWRTLIRQVTPRAATVTRPLFLPAAPAFPGCLSPQIRLGCADPEHALSQIEGTSGEVLLTELHDTFGEDIPSQWRPVEAAPENWLRAYTAVLRAIWAAIEPFWRKAGDLFDREAERIGTAVVKGAPDAVMIRLGPRYHYADGSLYLQDRHPLVLSLDKRRLVLVPLMSGMRPSLFDIESPDQAWIGYPLPGQGALHGEPSRQPSACDALVLTVGATRASILRAVDIPSTMSALAQRIGSSGPNVTHHCRQLEAAGLIVRVRRGSSVRARRTPRGDELLDLLSGT